MSGCLLHNAANGSNSNGHGDWSTLSGNGSKFATFTSKNFAVIRVHVYFLDGFLQVWIKDNASYYLGTS